jgi:hypothetical protein
MAADSSNIKSNPHKHARTHTHKVSLNMISGITTEVPGMRLQLQRVKIGENDAPHPQPIIWVSKPGAELQTCIYSSKWHTVAKGKLYHIQNPSFQCHKFRTTHVTNNTVICYNHRGFKNTHYWQRMGVQHTKPIILMSWTGVIMEWSLPRPSSALIWNKTQVFQIQRLSLVSVIRNWCPPDRHKLPSIYIDLMGLSANWSGTNQVDSSG